MAHELIMSWEQLTDYLGDTVDIHFDQKMPLKDREDRLSVHLHSRFPIGWKAKVKIRDANRQIDVTVTPLGGTPQPFAISNPAKRKK